MLKVVYKRYRTASYWQRIAILEIDRNAQVDGASIDDFVRGFNNNLKRYPAVNNWRLELAYKALKVDSKTAVVYWTNHVKEGGKDVLIATVSIRDND